MVMATRRLYSSANGDEWHLVRDPSSGNVSVRHQPNGPSGGRTAFFEVGEFLIRGVQHGPEHLELLRLIGTLVEDDPSG